MKWLILLLLLGAWDLKYRKNADVEAGNQAFAAKDWDEAIRRYRQAAADLPGDAGVHFDLGAAMLHKAQALAEGQEREQALEAAARELRLAGDASDAKLKSGAHYNLGNLEYSRQKYQEAVDEYKKSLKLDPQDEDARHNLEMALAQLQKQPPPPPQGGGQDKKQQKQDQQQKQKQQSGQQDQQQQDQEKAQGQAEKPEPDQNQKDQQKQEDQPQDQQPPPGQKPEPDQKPGSDQGQKPQEQKPGDDTDRKLDSLERRSKDLQVGKERARAQAKRRQRPAKDW